ncbi:MAG: FeoA domain-containing protein [Anaerolineae bacterium]|nr:FeoA domain-containing protein [Anaerolineae bacterium]
MKNHLSTLPASHHDSGPRRARSGLTACQEELLEAIWTWREEGQEITEAALASVPVPDSEKAVQGLAQEGYILRENGRVVLTTRGEAYAEQVVRRHRLAEVLLIQVLEVEEKRADASACQFEHILSAEVTDRICTFLGHPPLCPHGKPIPRGDCCARFQRQVEPLVTSLADFELGMTGQIVFMTARQRNRLARLSQLGIAPGSTLRLLQRRPTYVVQAGETEIALEGEIAREIFVRRVSA